MDQWKGLCQVHDPRFADPDAAPKWNIVRGCMSVNYLPVSLKKICSSGMEFSKCFTLVSFPKILILAVKKLVIGKCLRMSDVLFIYFGQIVSFFCKFLIKYKVSYFVKLKIQPEYVKG